MNDPKQKHASSPAVLGSVLICRVAVLVGHFHGQSLHTDPHTHILKGFTSSPPNCCILACAILSKIKNTEYT